MLFPPLRVELEYPTRKLYTCDTYIHISIYQSVCFRLLVLTNSTHIGKYIAQVARFDPSKGIPTVIDSYAEFRRQLDKMGVTDTPQLVV